MVSLGQLSTELHDLFVSGKCDWLTAGNLSSMFVLTIKQGRMPIYMTDRIAHTLSSMPSTAAGNWIAALVLSHKEVMELLFMWKIRKDSIFSKWNDRDKMEHVLRIVQL